MKSSCKHAVKDTFNVFYLPGHRHRPKKTTTWHSTWLGHLHLSLCVELFENNIFTLMQTSPDWVSPLFPGSSPPSSTSPSCLWPFPPWMLILFPIVSSSLRTGNGWIPWIRTQRGVSRKWSHSSTCNQETEQRQQGGRGTGHVRSHTCRLCIYTQRSAEATNTLWLPLQLLALEPQHRKQNVSTFLRRISTAPHHQSLLNIHTQELR